MDFTSQIFGNRQTLLWFLDYRIEQRLRPYAEALEWFLSELFRGVLPCDWREGWHAFVADQAIQGRITEPQSVREMEVWIEGWAKFCGLLPPAETEATPSRNVDEFNRERRHPSNPQLSYKFPDGSDLTERDAVIALDLAKVAQRYRAAVAVYDQAYNNPSFLSNLNEALNPFVDPIARLGNLQQQLFEFKSLLWDVEQLYSDLGYDEIWWSKFGSAQQTGIQAAEWMSQAGPPHGIRGVTVETLFTAASVAGLTKLGAKVIARGSARLAQRVGKLVRPPEALSDEAARTLKSVVDEELAKLSADPAIAQTVLRRSEIAASVNPRIARMQFGRALERLVGDRVERSPVLQRLLEYHGRSAGPDFVGVGRFEGLILDLTTPGQVAKHAARPYGKDLIIVTYTRPPTFP